MKNNLFAIIKFVSINKYFRRKQAAEAKTNNKFWMHFDSLFGDWREREGKRSLTVWLSAFDNGESLKRGKRQHCYSKQISLFPPTLATKGVKEQKKARWLWRISCRNIIVMIMNCYAINTHTQTFLPSVSRCTMNLIACK